MAKLGMTKRKYQAARLLAEGMNPKDVAQEIGVHFTTVYEWQHEVDFVDAILVESDLLLARTVPKARLRLSAQVDDANGWLAQNASNSLLREHTGSKGAQAQQIVVTFGDAALNPGVPAIDEVDLPED